MLGVLLTFEVHSLGEKSITGSFSPYVPFETCLLGTASPLLQYHVKATPGPPSPSNRRCLLIRAGLGWMDG